LPNKNGNDCAVLLTVRVVLSTLYEVRVV